MPKSVHIAVDIPAGAKAQNAEWLVSDHEVDDIGKYRFNIAVDGDNIVQYTVDSGANWLSVNSGIALSGNSSFGFDIYVRPGDLINFRCPDSGGTTVILGRLDSVKDEG